jgi:cytochrome c2
VANGARLLALLGALVLAACGESDPPGHLRVLGGDAERGRTLVESYGCGACHTIPGVARADGRAAPPLVGFARRTMLAGVAPNAPRTIVPWLMNPDSISPGTRMPALGLTQTEARHVAAFLYTLGVDHARAYPPEPPPLTLRRHMQHVTGGTFEDAATLEHWNALLRGGIPIVPAPVPRWRP